MSQTRSTKSLTSGQTIVIPTAADRTGSFSALDSAHDTCKHVHYLEPEIPPNLSVTQSTPVMLNRSHGNLRDNIRLPPSPLQQHRIDAVLQASRSASSATDTLRRTMKHASRKDSSRKVAFTFPLQVSKRKTRDGRALSSSDVRLHMTEHRPLHIPPGLPHEEFKGRRPSHTQKVKATSSKSKPLGRFPKQDVIGNLINYAWTPGARNLNNSAKERLKKIGRASCRERV